MGRVSKYLVPLAALAIILAMAVGLRVMMMPAESQNGGAPAIGGGFTLVDQKSRVVTDEAFRGRWMLIYFGYTYCPDVCPTSLQVMSDALDMLPDDKAAKVASVFITIDPERDTPEQLDQYVSNFHPAMIGLTGSKEQIQATLKAYRVYAAKAGEGESYTMDHSSIIYLMGPDGRFVTHFGHGTTPQQLAEALRQRL